MQLTTHFYWNENFDYTLMDILKNNWDSPLEYLFNKYYFKKIRNHIQYLQFFLKNNTNVYVNKILFNPFISIPFINSFLNPKIQMEHSHLIVEPNVALNFIFIFLICHFMTTIIMNYWRVCPNLIYYTKTCKFLQHVSKY